MKTTAIIVAAGEGKRMGLPVPKPFLQLKGVPILARTLSLFESEERVHEIVLVVSKEQMDGCRGRIVERFGYRKVRCLVPGGKTRQDSVYQGFLQSDPTTDLILVHDGVRPFLNLETARKAIQLAERYGASIVAIPVSETVKEVGPEGTVTGTIDRTRLWRAQTPQVFKRAILEAAFKQALADGFQGTDEASLVERLQRPIRIAEGSPENIKITTREDLAVGEFILEGLKKE